MPLTIGDIVLCISAYHRDELGLGDGPGMVMEVRRGDAKIFFWERHKSAWLENGCLAPMEDAPPWPIGTAHRLMRLLGGISCTVLEARDDGGTLEIAFRELPHRRVDEVREMLGEALVDLVFEPGSMTKIVARIAYRRKAAGG